MIWYDMIWYDMIRYMIWYDMIWCDTIRYDIRYDMIWYDAIRYDMTYDMIYLTAAGFILGGNSTVHINTQTTNRHKQYIEQHSSLIRKSADRVPSLRGIPWHLPYNWIKAWKKPQYSTMNNYDPRAGNKSGVTFTGWARSEPCVTYVYGINGYMYCPVHTSTAVVLSRQ